MKDFHLITLLINQIAVIAESYLDVRRKGKGKTIHHRASNWFRALSWISAAVIIHWMRPGFFGLSVIYCLVLGFQYWLSFNIFYNQFDRKEWHYSGTGFMDSILPGRENRFKNIGLKTVLFLLSAFVYFDLYGIKE